MPLLHDYFHLRNQQAFQRLLDGITDRTQPGGALSTSSGKSRPSPLVTGAICDVNARDWLGRTVLHLACAAPNATEYVRLLLRHPSINVNLADIESHWTPLHRALYHANFTVALLLLQHPDTDGSLRDLEGYTAFDLYNSTLTGTKPLRDVDHAELYTWGINRNAALGYADGNDRMYPEQVFIQKKEDSADQENARSASCFLPIHVRYVQMSKLHSAVITSEHGSNLQLCGFGSGGRLGSGQHMQYKFKPLQNFPHTIISVALGQDHTMALTKSGEVFTWGLNRFSQLGYASDTPGPGEGFGKTEEAIQVTPRKVLGPLRKEIVKGVAASKTASACWTDTDVYTWGTNSGQLGYDKAAQTVQVLPRKATKVNEPVVSITITDTAMVCLLSTHDVICIWNDRHMKIIFPGPAFPPEMQPYRPRQAAQDAKIVKVTSCDDMFVALSFSGELFFFSATDPSKLGASSGKDRTAFKPQRVWALRKKFSSVKDVALGSDGSIIICTESGHVFVRSRNLKSGQTSTSGKAFKFQRLPSLQRITQVCANSTGAFGALRVEYRPKPIDIRANTFTQDLWRIQPYLLNQNRLVSRAAAPYIGHSEHLSSTHNDDRDDNLQCDIDKLQTYFYILEEQIKSQKKVEVSQINSASHLAHGANVMIHLTSGFIFPAHRIVLASRSQVLRDILTGASTQKKLSSVSLLSSVSTNAYPTSHLKLIGCQPLSVLILLTYLYTDEVLAPWDHRVALVLTKSFKLLRINPSQIKIDLQILAELLALPALASALESPVKCPPTPSLVVTFQNLFDSSQIPVDSKKAHELGADVILELSDKEVHCHSVILRARSEFFSDFLDEEEWTWKRWDAVGVVRVDMKHLNWRIMDCVLKFMCYGAEEKMFDSLIDVTLDELLEYIFDVMAAATELLLDRLVLLCSHAVLQHINLQNACFILSEATHLHAEQLIERAQSFIMVNMELFLENGKLDDIPAHLIQQLGVYVKSKQIAKSPVSRSNQLANQALVKHAGWLALQDLPVPIGRPRSTIRRSSDNLKSVVKSGSMVSPRRSPGTQRPMDRLPSSDDIFAMDDTDIGSHSSITITVVPNSSVRPNITSTPVWKATSNPRINMKTVMAEAASASLTQQSNDISRTSPPSDIQGLLHRTDLKPGGGAGSSHSSASWRAPTEQVPVRLSLPSTPPQGTLASRPSSSPQRSPSGPSKPGLGPTITPTRQTSLSTPSPISFGIRRTSGNAWSKPKESFPKPSQPPMGMSFLAIQQLELEQMAGAPNKPSLREIQEEEQALQAEADFLAWWTAEEERIKLETQMIEETAKVSHEKLGTGKGRSSGKNRNSPTTRQSHHQPPDGSQGQSSNRTRKVHGPSQDQEHRRWQH